MKERLLTDVSMVILIIMAIFLAVSAVVVFSVTRVGRGAERPIREFAGSAPKDERFEVFIVGETYKMRGRPDSVGNPR